MIKAGVKLSFVDGLPPYRSAAADATSLAEARSMLAVWKLGGRSMTMKHSGDGVLAAYDGMQAAARVNMREMEDEERSGVVTTAKSVLAMMTLCPPVNTPNATWRSLASATG